jgi:hypothetical protein
MFVRLNILYSLLLFTLPIKLVMMHDLKIGEFGFCSQKLYVEIRGFSENGLE